MSKLTSITIEQAKVYYATEPEGTPLWAAANTIISLYATIALYERAAEDADDDKAHDSREAVADVMVDEFLGRLRYMVQP